MAEGATEEKLLPVFAAKAGLDFDKEGVQLIAAGGKNQVAKLYNELSPKLNIPVLLLLDADAQPIAEKIKENILVKDKLFLISKGEFEDILSSELICKAINNFYKTATCVNCSDLGCDLGCDFGD